MSFSRPTARRSAALFAATFAAGALATVASAQFEPPSTVWGSVTDSAGPVEAGLPVEAYIGDTLCGTNGKTEYTGDGDARVTVYALDVVSEAQEEGCGKAGAEVRVKIGDRFADDTVGWEAGPVRLDVTFGSASPVAIPTFTPAPTRTPEPTRAGGTPAPGTTPGAAETIPPGSPGAGSPVRGGVSTATPGVRASVDDDDGGFPVWGVVGIVLVVLAAVAGGAGYMLSRNRGGDLPDDESDDDRFFPPGDGDH